jgi:hypothetical protein
MVKERSSAPRSAAPSVSLAEGQSAGASRLALAPGESERASPRQTKAKSPEGARSAPRSAAPSAPTSVGPLGHLGHDQEARAGDDRKRRQWTVRAVTALRLESVRGFTFLACARDGFGRPADFPGSWTRPSKRFIVD